jgi:hypothetical protein
MQFDCGVYLRPLTEKDRQNLKKWAAQGQRWLAKRAHKMRWHPWYAWFPVRLRDNDCRWLEWVERKIEYSGPVAPMERMRHYREGAKE